MTTFRPVPLREFVKTGNKVGLRRRCIRTIRPCTLRLTQIYDKESKEVVRTLSATLPPDRIDKRDGADASGLYQVFAFCV